MLKGLQCSGPLERQFTNIRAFSQMLVQETKFIFFRTGGVEPYTAHFDGRDVAIPPRERLISGDTSSQSSLSMAQDWIDICDEEHHWKNSKTALLPKRVLDIHDGRVRLLHTESMSGLCSCLSYRSSPEPILWRTSNVIGQFEDDIP